MKYLAVLSILGLIDTCSVGAYSILMLALKRDFVRNEAVLVLLASQIVGAVLVVRWWRREKSGAANGDAS